MSKLKVAKKLYDSLEKKIIAIKTKFRDKYDDNHQKIIDSPEYKKLLKKRLTRDEKNLLKEEKTNPLNSGEFELFLPFKDGTFITGISRVKGVRKKVSMKDKRPEPSKSPPKAKIEKGLGRTLTEREKQYLKSDSDLNPKNFYKGGVVDIVDAGKYFKHKPKK
mgnify:CR=1 FL=1|tara:strand:+ start:38 stop:526 length:489 start_codon:yes stop_codon:yes gene_type:complete